MRNAVIALALMAVAVCTCSKKGDDPGNGVAPPRPVYPSDWQMPAWSPDGKTIACFREGIYDVRLSGRYSVDFERRGFYLMDADGSNQRKISNDEIMSPAWHPSGDSLVFSMVPYGGAIFKADTTMDSLIQLTEVNGHFQPSWSPDGTRIAYHGIFPPENGLWVMDADGSNKRYLGVAYRPSWSPDGARIACAGFGGLSVMDSSGENVKVLAPENGPDRICWSPTGESIFFSGYERLFRYRIDADTLVELAISAYYPSLSPNESQVVYLSYTWVYYSPQNGNLWIMNADGSDKHQITFSEGGDSLR